MPVTDACARPLARLVLVDALEFAGSSPFDGPDLGLGRGERTCVMAHRRPRVLHRFSSPRKIVTLIACGFTRRRQSHGSSKRNRDSHGGPAPRLSIQFERAVQRTGSLAHIDQSQAARATHSIRIETLPVVGHSERNEAVRARQANVHVPCAASRRRAAPRRSACAPARSAR